MYKVGDMLYCNLIHKAEDDIPLICFVEELFEDDGFVGKCKQDSKFRYVYYTEIVCKMDPDNILVKLVLDV